MALRLNGLLVGDSQVGKSALLERWQGYPDHVGRNTVPGRVRFDVKFLRGIWWEACLDLEEANLARLGQRAPEDITRWQTADLLVLVYDVTRQETLRHLIDATPALRKVMSRKPVVFLVANKVDHSGLAPGSHNGLEQLEKELREALRRRFCTFGSLEMSCLDTEQAEVDHWLKDVIWYLCNPPDFDVYLDR